MGNFDVSALQDALKGLTNISDKAEVAEKAESAAMDDAVNKAIHGWNDPTPFDYTGFSTSNTSDWAGNAARYEWKDEYGDVGPANPELEKQLFEVEFRSKPGERLRELNETPVVNVESEQPLKPVISWDGMGLHPVMRENIELCCYKYPTTIQSWAIPAVLQGKDLIGIAQTGSGKTGAFLIPVLSKLMGKAKKLAAARPNVAEGFDSQKDGVTAEPLVLIICPTRELATQDFDETRRLCYRSMLRPCVAYGGAPARLQRDELRKGCDILVGTPGRIIDFMSQPHVLTLTRVRYTIVDEADEMLHSDWQDEFSKLMSGGDGNEDTDHCYMMFSATFNRECRQLARTFLASNHIRIRIGRPGSAHLMVRQQVYFVEERQKKQALFDLLVSMIPIRTLVFVNNKKAVDYVDDFLYNKGLPSTSIHSDRTQREREDAMRAFKYAKCPIMVATGLSARGLDIVNVMHVINFDLPKAMHGGINEYIHRIGRTARIGNEGLATSFYNEGDADLAPDLVKTLLECNQNVPDFLEDFTPSGGKITFGDETDAEDEEDNDNAAKASAYNATETAGEDVDPWEASGDTNADRGANW
ncbi:DEAD/DEAH box RNA helicase [Penicillium chermesinum]|nr:DEAD/DEAH box RNA helicase [Penicillium chermesinum]